MSDDHDQTLETPALSGTVKLARAALTSPEPSAAAETDLRKHVETLMQEAALSPRALHASGVLPPPQKWWQKLLLRRK